MGKVLIQKYDFIHDENSVVLHDNYSLNRILLITNVTRNQTLYAFNVERLGLQDVIYDYPNNETTLILKTDTTQMDPSDELQIFIEKDYTTFEPSETFLDPVSKLRVSTPSNLIDTDFEYGLQGTKWETIQTVNNIPTIYSSSGDVPIEGVVLVEATNESKQIKVVTTLAHGLSIGDPISVQGVDLYTAEGFFIVSGVADANTFFFEIDEVSDVSGEINGGYTTINAAKFFEGSPLPISDKDGTETDGATPSNILVTTEATHGLAIGTKLYVRNTVGPKNLLIQNTAAIAEDSRPFVDTEPFFTTGVSIDTTANTNRGSFREKPVIGYDWESTYTLYLEPDSINPTTSQITWTAHEFNNAYALLFNTPAIQETAHGLVDGTVYYVKVIDSDTIELYTNTALTSKVTVTTTESPKGLSRLGLCYKVESASGNSRRTAFNSNFAGGSMQFISASRYNVRGAGTPTNPFSGESTNLGLHRTTASATFRVLTAGTVFWTMDVSSEAGYDYSRLRINGSLVYNRAGTGRQSGQTFAPAGATISAEYYKDGSVNSRADRGYIISLYMASPVGNNVNLSGADFATYSFGLGKVQPTRAVAFQGRTPGSFSNSNDGFSFLANQRTNGRYGTIQGQYTNNVSSTTNRGEFTINFNNATRTFGGTSEIFYVFARDLNADKNTIFLPNHGISDATEAIITMTESQFNNGERFKFSNSSGAAFEAEREFQAVMNVLSNDVFRIQRIANPISDDILDWPLSGFSIEYREENALYNTIFVNNHKITGSEEALYAAEGRDLPATVSYNVAVDSTDTAFVLNGIGLGVNELNPTLVVYRNQPYAFNVDAINNGLYLTTDNGVNFVADGYVDEYTVGVTNSRTQAGVLSWTVDANAPDTLYYQGANNSNLVGTIIIRDAGTDIPGITSNETYRLVRVNDSRLTLSNVVSDAATQTSGAIGATNNNTVSVNLNVQSILGITPTSASIQSVQFRGNFGNESQYVEITFEDGETFLIGQRNGSNSSVFQTDQFFPVKNISSLLKNIGGGSQGITIVFNPTSQINRRVFGMTNLWELRFVLSGDSGVIILQSGGNGVQTFKLENVLGSYDGLFNIKEVPAPNQFVIGSDFNIPARRYEFNETQINATTNIISLQNPHNLITGEKLIYDNNGQDSIFEDEIEEYYAIAVNATDFKIAESNLSAVNNQNVSLIASSGDQSFISKNVIKAFNGIGTLKTIEGSKVLVGNGSRFLRTFKRFDTILIQGPNFIQAFTIDVITTEERLIVFENIPFTANDVNYFFPSQMILRPDGFGLHKPFDGGVDITAGTSPNSKIVRQTRKYFRYQSGKGIQNSYAINFNPPKEIQRLRSGGGTTAVVECEVLHRLRVGDNIEIVGAETNTDVNPYLGRFIVSEVTNPFIFQYEMNSEPEESFAGGFPAYIRSSWNDSAIRAGMFDDQNGFFYEFDGQKIYAVRRSSTLQLTGTVSAFRGSQIIAGVKTSFNTQIAVGDKVVIRGQSYLVVEVSSDTRIVVQPAYRGVTAKKIKITKTVDVRVPQDQWSVDRCDGTGPTGYFLRINKIQMAYMDYSWYGAGKVRFGFKDTTGHVKYVHEFIHNNILDESYFRSGNLPGRYEIENGPNADASPTLFHFGTSVIMDGGFEDDKAYLFSSSSKPFAFTNGANRAFVSTGVSQFDLITLDGSRVFVYAIPVSAANASSTIVGSQIKATSSDVLPAGTYVTQVRVDGTNSAIFVNFPATSVEPSGAIYPDIANNTSLTIGEIERINLTEPIPLLSLRLAPSADSGITGAVGEREIINRMQLDLSSASVTSNQALEIFLILNPIPSNLDFLKAQNPSLSQVVQHNAGDSLLSGITIYSTKASAGSIEINLDELLEMGNSILGGDGIFPAGPDLLTLAIQPQDTSQITGTTPFSVIGKITWTEAQA